MRHRNLSADIKAEIKEKNTTNRQSKRKNLPAGIKVEIKEKNKTYQLDKRNNLPADIKAQIQDQDTVKNQVEQKTSKEQRMEILNEIQGGNMINPSILDTPPFKLIEKEYRDQIKKGTDYICNICWKTERRVNVIELNP